MERDRVLRAAMVDAQRVVGAVLMQREQMQPDHRDDDEGQ